MKIKKAEELVWDILVKYESSRNDNDTLYALVIQSVIGIEYFRKIGLIEFLINRKELGVPSYETVTRVRRKIQSKHQELRPTEVIGNFRKIRETEFIKYNQNN